MAGAMAAASMRKFRARFGQHHGNSARRVFTGQDDGGDGERIKLREQARQALEQACRGLSGAKAEAATAIIGERLLVSDARYRTSRDRLGVRFGLTGYQIASIEKRLVRRARQIVEAAAKATGGPWLNAGGLDAPVGPDEARRAITAAAASIAGPSAAAAEMIARGRLLEPDRACRLPLRSIAEATGRSRQAVHQLEQRIIRLALQALRGAA